MEKKTCVQRKKKQTSEKDKSVKAKYHKTKPENQTWSKFDSTFIKAKKKKKT